jgi:hypothetical protein
MANIQRITFMGMMLAAVVIKGLSQQQVLASHLVRDHVRSEAECLPLLLSFSS